MTHLQNNPISKPELKTFYSARQFLNAEFKYRKNLNPKLSLESWCFELGYRSKSFLYMVISGKRTITSDLIEVLSKNLNLSPDETDYFTLLAHHENSETEYDKKIFLDKILEFRLLKENIIEDTSYIDFLSDVDLPAIKLLVSFCDFEGSLTRIAKTLNRTESETLEKLNLLENMGLVQKMSGEVNIWKAAHKAFAAPKHISEKAVNTFHQKTCEEASMKIGQDNGEFKRFRSITFTLGPEKKAEFLDEVDLFLNKMKHKFGSDELKDNDLVKMNLQAYSIIKNGDPF